MSYVRWGWSVGWSELHIIILGRWGGVIDVRQGLYAVSPLELNDWLSSSQPRTPIDQTHLTPLLPTTKLVTKVFPNPINTDEPPPGHTSEISVADP